ncbi:DUF6285 domain-containing protein [Mycobacterium bourgelatii]|uniref:DUF6285 domain-containing protein n=1 Tax=Mycobacterium bourgelatii TaxID=1273442 RepID=A0A7I9YKF0_MYCBU|nr:DUF6285 domain-containing protein [Mycobacterium bourgelatii]MCV6974631.1 hypothetical protein [Mycobacterium bourgelatii]GFG89098.1 hypothetical protein MBOU_11400 [Mycobacterium bourgelatii]
MSSNESPSRDRTATELLALVTQFLEEHVLPAATASPHSHDEIAAAVAALRIVEREMLGDPAGDATSRAALARLGFSDEAQLAAAIRNGDLDDRAADVTSCLRVLAQQRLAVANPGYQNE